jgi:hypothetical protein
MLPRALPNVVSEIVEMTCKLGKGRLMDCRGRKQMMNSPQQDDLFYEMMCDPKIHLSLTVVGSKHEGTEIWTIGKNNTPTPNTGHEASFCP